MNVIALTLADQRAVFRQRCYATFLGLAGWTTLFAVNWPVAIGLTLIAWSWITWLKSGGEI